MQITLQAKMQTTHQIIHQIVHQITDIKVLKKDCASCTIFFIDSFAEVQLI